MRSALWMLSRRALSEGEVRERLSKKGFPESDAWKAVSRLRELGLVDDPKLCDHLVRHFRDTRGYGPVKIAWALRARRFPPELVEEVLRNSSSGQEELTSASAALKKKFRDRLPPGRDGAARAYRFLAGRGFPPGTCRKAVGILFADIKEEEE